MLDELGEQRRLADAGRAGYADDVGGRLVAKRGGGYFGEERLGLPARVRGAAFDQVERRGGGGEVTVAQALAELAAVGRGAGVGQAPTALSTPWRSATSSMMSRIIPLRFQSLGV